MTSITESVTDRLYWIGCRPSLLTKVAIHAAHRVNVGKLPDTRHSTEPAAPTAVTDDQTFKSYFNQPPSLRIPC